jgi:hypothetical protein
MDPILVKKPNAVLGGSTASDVPGSDLDHKEENVAGDRQPENVQSSLPWPP